MKHFVFTSLLGIALACFANFAVAEIVTVDFEEFYTQIGDNRSWNGLIRDHSGYFPEGFLKEDPTGKTDEWGSTLSTYQSKGVTFSTASIEDWSVWSGTGLSTVTDTTFNEHFNDMASVSGKGNGNSNTYAVVYGSSVNNPSFDYGLPSILLPTGALIQSMAISNTVYLDHVLNNGNAFASSLTQAGDFMSLLIYGVGSDGELVDSVTQKLGEFTAENDLWTLSDWTTVDLTDLQGATELRFAFNGSDAGEWGLNTPSYFAFDDLKYKTATPEPATFAILGLGLAGLGLVRRRK